MIRQARSITLIEVIFAITATSIAVLGTLATINLSMQLDSVTDDKNAVARAIDNEVQSIFAMDRTAFVATFLNQPFHPQNPSGLVPLKNTATSDPDDTIPILSIYARGDGENQTPPQFFQECDYYSVYVEAVWDGGTVGEQRVALNIVVRPI